MVLNSLNDELNYILRESKTKLDYMFNVSYKRLMYVRSGDIRSALNPGYTLYRVLYDLPGDPIICIDILRDSVVFALLDEQNNDSEFSYSDGESAESAVFQVSTVRDLHHFNAETIGICKELSKLFYTYLDNRCVV